MKVLQINSVCGIGSTGKIVTDLYDVLKKNGHDSCIAFGRGTSTENYKTIKIGKKLDNYLHVLKTRILDLHGFGSSKATKKLIEQINEYQPDIIQLHNLHGYYVNIEILFSYLATLNVPIVWLLHDQWPISGHSAYLEEKMGNENREREKKSKKGNYPKTWFIDNSRNNLKRKREILTKIRNMTIITPSEWLANSVKNTFLGQYDVKVINNGIDLSEFKPTESEFREQYALNKKIVLLGVASVWEERKGLNYFNKLAEKLDSNYQIVLIGINKKIEKKVNSKIICISKTASRKELAAIYTTADIFLNPTIEDNFPTTNIEALACGTPVITFNTGGSAESLNSTTGISIQKYDLNALYEAIISFDYNKYNRNECIKRAKKFDKESIYTEYLKLYETLNIQ